MLRLGDRIAQCVLEAFKKLPAKAKPRSYGDGLKEWVPLAGIVLSKPSTTAGKPDAAGEAIPDELTCVSLGYVDNAVLVPSAKCSQRLSGLA